MKKFLNETEIEKHLKKDIMISADDKSGPFVFYQQYSKEFPKLTKLARAILCITARSIRMFVQQCRLGSDRIEKQVVTADA